MAENDTLDGLERRLRLPGLAARLAPALTGAAVPDLALRLVPEVLLKVAEATGTALARAWAQRANQIVRILGTLCGGAPFFAPVLRRHPDWLIALSQDDLTNARSPAEYGAGLTIALAGVSPGECADALRRFKYYELARITVRDLSSDLVSSERTGEILAELSHLTDVLLGEALKVAALRLEETYGPPQWRDPRGETVALSFCALGLGKLGSEELNYSSDVDLIYVFQDAQGEVRERLRPNLRGLLPAEYFTRLAQEFGRIVSEFTGEGFLYRIDLDLRPEGGQGPLVVSSDMLANYYELWAATWEKAAFMKARPVAGDLALGWRTIRAIAPMIYRSSMDFAAVDAIKAMKERVEQAKGRRGDTFDVKIGAGGIRDVEFVAQALQLLHGGRIPQVRGRSTQGALGSLAEVGVLRAADADDLLTGYRFLRRVENRIQMEAERQTHRLPSGPGLERLARLMGFSGDGGVAAFEETLQEQRRRIRGVFASLFQEEGQERVLALFARAAPWLVDTPATRPLIQRLAEDFAHGIDASVNPERAMNNLDRFIRGVGRRRFYYELLLDRPELIPRLAALFGTSEYFSTYFATHPRLIEPIFSDPNVLLLSRRELQDDLGRIRDDLAREPGRAPAELALDALRLFHNRALLNVGLLDLGGKVPPAAAERSLSDIAEVCVEGALEFAETEMRQRADAFPEVSRRGEFLVVGMGKLASREITYGSDLDVIFLYDVEGGDDDTMVLAQEYFVRLAQKLIGALRTRTAEGVCYEIDARLRPSGRQGTLVTSLASFESYHATSAQVWERQALLRARAVAGSPRLADGFEATRLHILERPLPANLGQEIHRLRLRMEKELAQESLSRHDFKTGRGGMQDVESIVQFLQLQHGQTHAELFAVADMVTQINRLERLAALGAEDARALRAGWEFLRLLASRLRIVQNRSISDLDEERGDLDALARRFGYPETQRGGGARRALLDDYRRHTTTIRAIYSRVLGLA